MYSRAAATEDKKLALTKSKKVLLIAIPLLAVIIAATVLTSVYFTTRNNALDFVEISVVTLDEKYLSTVDNTGDYLGHPDLVLADDGTLFCAYPAGHGKGEVIMKSSTNLGDTWSERITGLPESWKKSQETPTLYNLQFTDGSSKLLLVSGCPSWAEDDEYYADGFNCSISSDNGKTWTEFQNFYGIVWANSQPAKTAETDLSDPYSPNYDSNGKVLPYDVIVSMSSLTQLKENGKYVDKWMGTFHDYDFYNYTSILTFDDKGNPQWSQPKKFLHEQRAFEDKADLCEIEIVRAAAPDDDTLILLGRGNSRKTNSLISISQDEGETWSELRELPYALTGDRHKAEYDETTGKLLVSFRLVVPGVKRNIFDNTNFTGGYWVAWVGTFNDLLTYAKSGNKTDKLGEKLIVLGTTNDGKADCGYSGTICKDGQFVLTSYGKFSKDAKNPYIMQAKFRLSDVL